MCDSINLLARYTRLNIHLGNGLFQCGCDGVVNFPVSDGQTCLDVDKFNGAKVKNNAKLQGRCILVKKGKKVMERHKTIWRNCWTITNTHVRRFLHILQRFKHNHCLINTNRTFSSRYFFTFLFSF